MRNEQVPAYWIGLYNNHTIKIMTEYKQLWDSVLHEVELNVSKANFSTWFRNTHIVRHEDGIVFVGVPNEFAKDWLFNKYHKLILRSLRDLSQGVRGLEYAISKGVVKEEETKKVMFTPTDELPLSDLYIDKRDNLNPRYTFSSFVIGPFNELAHAAAQAVIKSPGAAYNPFFIYGGTGLGKTHLIQAVGNHIKEHNPSSKIHYVTSEKFSVDYITSVQNNNVNAFKEKYRDFDVFIMDDIQFFSNKEKTQEELFHLFNVLSEGNKQIIFSSDEHPNFIRGLEERLKSRFGAGMIVDVSQPDYESRVAILKHKSASRNFFPSDDITEYLASSLDVNIRELEGILNTLICQAQIKNGNIGIEDIKGIIKNSIKPKKTASVKDIVKTVAEFYNVDEASIYEKTRRKEIVRPRQVIMYLLREDYSISYPTIGEKMGGRDHTTVIHSCEKIKKDLKQDGGLQQEMDQLRAVL